jgi:RNA polymerase sigma-70 factor (ECF subfamily)
VNPKPLDELLEKLCKGDAAAAEQVFAAYEPYLRKVVRRLMPEQMRRRFDSIDIVQSVWGDVLSGFREAGWRFTNTVQLQAFLVKVTRNRFIDRCRQHNTSLAREKSLEESDLPCPGASSLPGPVEAADATELWDRLLALCPSEHHELLRLKRQGFSNAEIGDQTGLHPGSVRRVLRELAVRVDPQRRARL